MVIIGFEGAFILHSGREDVFIEGWSWELMMFQHPKHTHTESGFHWAFHQRCSVIAHPWGWDVGVCVSDRMPSVKV